MPIDSTVPLMTLKQMRREISADSPLFAGCLSPGPDTHPACFSGLFATASECEGEDGNHYCFALEYIYEGYLLHYGVSRLLETGHQDLKLLAGDYMYARGLNRIAALGDPFCVMALARLIEMCSYIHCRGMGDDLALRTWAAVTLCLAGRAAGDPDCEEKTWPALSRFIMGALEDGSATGTPEALIEEMLARWQPARRKEIRAVLDNIYAGYGHIGSQEV